MPVNKTIPLHLLDDPEIAMRSEIDDEYIASLSADIAKNGLINPVAVTRAGERYTVVAGHCRTIAKRKLGHADIEVRDYTDDPVDPETIKCRENLGRRDVDDAYIAEYLSDIQTKHHHTLEKLQEITGESEDWISKRLSLFSGDRAVFEALRAKQIGLGHALVLNKFPDEYRAQYLDIAIKSTPPVRVLKEWLDACKNMRMAPLADTAAQTPANPDAPPPGVVIDACKICNGTGMVWTMEFIKVHAHCLKMILDAIQQQESGG